MLSRLWTVRSFVFYSVVCALLTVLSQRGSEFSVLSTLVPLLAGFFLWSPLEYTLHRFAFHFDAKGERGKKFVYDHHLVHHENPNDTSDLFASLTTTVPPAAGHAAMSGNSRRSCGAIPSKSWSSPSAPKALPHS